MPVIFINGIPVANSGRYGIDSYYTPQYHLRDVADVQDVEYEEVESTNLNTNKYDNQLRKELMDET